MFYQYLDALFTFPDSAHSFSNVSSLFLVRANGTKFWIDWISGCWTDRTRLGNGGVFWIWSAPILAQGKTQQGQNWQQMGKLHQVDALEASHPVSVTVNDPKEINSLFDHAISYSKVWDAITFKSKWGFW